MEVDEILDKHRLTRDNAKQYIDAITRLNQSKTADEIGVSRSTISRYKNAFQDMTDRERALLIASLLQEKLLEHYTESGEE